MSGVGDLRGGGLFVSRIPHLACFFFAFDFCLGTSPRFEQQAQTIFFGLKAISFWVGACDTRGQGPPAQ